MVYTGMFAIMYSLLGIEGSRDSIDLVAYWVGAILAYGGLKVGPMLIRTYISREPGTNNSPL